MSDKVWPRDAGGTAKISIGFLDGTITQQQRVRTIAGKWEEACRGVKFVWSTPPGNCSNSDVRITFNSTDWYSKIGTEAKKVTNKSLSTTRLKWRNEDNEMNRQILHEFGHILGAEHEHFSPHFPYKWKRAPVTNYWKDVFKRSHPTWNDQRVTDAATKKFDHDIARRLSQRDHHMVTTPFDGQSIMLYYIKKEWLEKNPSFRDNPRDFPGNYRLSETDKETVNRVYRR